MNYAEDGREDKGNVSFGCPIAVQKRLLRFFHT